MKRKLFVVARWDRKNIQKTWSGTGYSLLEGLSCLFNVERISLINSWWYRYMQIARRLGLGVLSKPLEDIQTVVLRRNVEHDKKVPVFMISGVFDVENPSYLFMDNIWKVAELLRSDQAQKAGYFDHFYSYSKTEIDYHIHRQYSIFSQSKAIFVMGDWLATYMKSVYPEFASKVYAIGGGCNAMPMVEAPQRSGNKILFVGKAFERKGGDLVVKAFKLLRIKYRNDAELIVVGPAQCPPDCTGEGISFKGTVSFNEVAALMQSCDVFCMPSRFEAYGLVFVEALVSGLPCIGRNAFEMPHFIEKGITGELIEQDDPETLARVMAEVLGNQEMKRNVAIRKYDFEKYYNWDRICVDIARIIEEKEHE